MAELEQGAPLYLEHWVHRILLAVLSTLYPVTVTGVGNLSSTGAVSSVLVCVNTSVDAPIVAGISRSARPPEGERMSCCWIAAVSPKPAPVPLC